MAGFGSGIIHIVFPGTSSKCTKSARKSGVHIIMAECHTADHQRFTGSPADCASRRECDPF